MSLAWQPRSGPRDGKPDLVQESSSPFPDVDILTAGLTSVLRTCDITCGHITVLSREPNIHGSYPSEIVTCKVNARSVLRLFCKYGSEQNENGYVGKRGVPYETAVYRHVLQPLKSGTPRFYGAHADASTGETWLILECIDRSARLNLATEPEAAMGLAARWIGRFHAANEMRFSSASLPFLITYDAEYYRGWVRRTLLFANHLHRRFPWLAPLCERAEEFVTALLAPRATVIHGEYYPRNILYGDGVVCPVDWESTAIAAGEIDLASLIEAWPEEIVRKCESEYQRARWPGGTPSDFEQRLKMAHLYIQLRWLGERPEWTTDGSSLPRFERLYSVGRRAGLVPE